MKKHFSRPLAALIALLLALSMLSACASPSNGDVQTPPDSTPQDQPANAEPAVTSPPEASESVKTTASEAEAEPEATTTAETTVSVTETTPAATQPTTQPTTAATTQAATTAAPATTAAVTTTVKVEPASGNMYAKSSVNVRSGPGTEYERVGHLDAGEEVELTGLSENGWYRIKFEGGEHFVSAKYLVKDKPAAVTAATTAKTEKEEADTAFIRDNGMEFVWKSMSNASAKENVAAVMNGMYECSEKIHLPHPVKEDDIWLFVHYVHDYTCGYSHLKWYEYAYWYDGNRMVTDIQLYYSNTKAKAAEKMDAVNKRVDEIVADAPEDSEYERVKYLHDQLVNNCSYDYTFAKADIYNAYGALIRGEAVCHGYANAMQLLLSRAGFDAVTVIGDVEGGGFHKWNYVKLSDGKWYGIDPTWNDNAEGPVTYNFFLVSDKTMKDGGHAKQYGSIYFSMPSSKEDYKAK